MKRVTGIMAFIAPMLLLATLAHAAPFTATASNAPACGSSWLAFPGGTAVVMDPTDAETLYNPYDAPYRVSQFQCTVTNPLVGYMVFFLEVNGQSQAGFPLCIIGPGQTTCPPSTVAQIYHAADKSSVWILPGGFDADDPFTCTATFSKYYF